MLIRPYRDYFIEKLGSIYDRLEAETIFYIVLKDVNQMTRVRLALDPDSTFSGSEVKRITQYLDRLLTHEPWQYILGETTFYGFDFKVTPDVLIPRPETEELVDWIIKRHTNQYQLAIADICTGSGCIAISLAKKLDVAQTSAIDISKEALLIANKNAKNLDVAINFELKDVLKMDVLSHKCDVIVSNPPYIRNLEKIEISPNVLDHEPHLALFVEDHEALIFYKKIASLALDSLHEGGVLYFEINQYLSEEMYELLVSVGFKDVQLKKDIFGNFRMISGTK